MCLISPSTFICLVLFRQFYAILLNTQIFLLNKQMQYVEIEYPLLCFCGLEAVTS